jgi:hypothetical protein
MTDGDVQHIEMQVLAGFLDAQRASVLAIVDGLDQEALQAVVFSSGWTPLGLIEHLGHAERHWFQRVTIDQLQCRDRPRAPGAPLRAPPVRVAIRAGPDGQARRLPCPGPLGELEPGAVHLRQPKPGRGLRETAAAACAQIYQVGASLSRRHRAKSRARSAARVRAEIAVCHHRMVIGLWAVGGLRPAVLTTKRSLQPDVPYRAAPARYAATM